jgi:cytochrome c peroxidase
MKHLRSTPFISLFFILSLFILACQDDDSSEPTESEDLLDSIAYNPTPYNFEFPMGYPSVTLPTDNPMTEQGILLGRKLFFDPILSADSSQACASCHLAEHGFTDGNAVSLGIDGIAGTRSSMSLVDLAYVRSGLFWDGRVATLEEQALIPVEDPIEMHHSWPEVIEDLKNHPEYPRLFREAFGINTKSEITKELAAKSMAQFERTILSSGQSKYDRFIREEAYLNASELRGFIMFFNHESEVQSANLPDAECSHCHAAPTFASNDFINNGITAVDSNLNYPDIGRANVTGNFFDRGKFRVPTLRNIALTAPYMHDGKFETLEEVLEHYNSGGHPSLNSDPLIYPLGLSEDQKIDIINFLHTLTDTSLINRADLQSP